MKKSTHLAFIKYQLATKKKAALKALMLIYSRQTETEQEINQTTEHNAIGFSGVDAELLSSFAKQYQKTGYLTAKQMDYLYRKISKYSRQVYSVCNIEELDKLCSESCFSCELFRNEKMQAPCQGNGGDLAQSCNRHTGHIQQLEMAI